MEKRAYNPDEIKCSRLQAFAIFNVVLIVFELMLNIVFGVIDVIAALALHYGYSLWGYQYMSLKTRILIPLIVIALYMLLGFVEEAVKDLKKAQSR